MQFGCKGSKNIAYLQIFVEFSVLSFAINVLKKTSFAAVTHKLFICDS